MSKFAKMTMLPRELAYSKIYPFFSTEIGLSLRIPNTVFRILVDVAVTWRFIHGIKNICMDYVSKYNSFYLLFLSNLLLL